MPQVALHRRHRPVGYAKGPRGRVEDGGLGNPVLRRARAVGLHQAAAAQGPLSDYGAGGRHGLGHGDVVAHPGAGDGLLEAVGIDEHIGGRAKHRGTQFQGQGIVEQHHHLRRLRDGESAVLGKGAAGAPVVGLLVLRQAIQLAQALVGSQRAHGGIALHHFRIDRRLG